MTGLRLLLAGLRLRRGASILVLLAAAFVVAAASSGPVYLQAGKESVLQDTLRPLSPARVGITTNRTGPQGAAAQTSLAGDVAAARVGLIDHLPTVLATEVSDQLRKGGMSLSNLTLSSRDGACAQITIKSGRCPTAAGEIVLSTPSAAALFLEVGDALTMTRLALPGGAPEPLTLVGIYDVDDPDAPEWVGREYFPSTEGGESNSVIVDAGFTVPGTFTAADPSVQVTAVADIPLAVRTVRTADDPHLRPALTAFSARIKADDAAAGGFTDQRGISRPRTMVQSTLSTWLDVALRREHDLALPVLLVAGQLVLLGLVALGALVTSTLSARAPEVALVRLRGSATAAVVWTALGDVVVLLLPAAALGLVVARLVIGQLASSTLLLGTPVKLTPDTGGAVLVAVAGGAVAAFVGALGVLRADVATVMRREGAGDPRRAWVRLAAVTVVVVVATGLVLAKLLSTSLPPAGRPAGLPVLITPGVCAVAAALLAALLLPAAAGAFVRRTADLRPLMGALAARQLARRPATRLVLVLTAAVALAVQSTATADAFARNRTDRALVQIGAPEVLTVLGPDARTLEKAVRAADPGGHEAMAVAASNSPQERARVVAVDSSRYANLGWWRASDVSDSLAVLRDPTDVADPLPSVLGARAYEGDVGGADAFELLGIDGRPVPLQPVGSIPVIPQFGPVAAVVDLDQLLLRTDDSPEGAVELEVWLHPEASAAVRAQLAANGFTVTTDVLASTQVDILRRQAPSLGASLAFAGAGAALLLAVLAAVVELQVLGRRRAYELASLRVLGIGPRRLLAQLCSEQVLLLSVAAVGGLLAGAGAASATLPRSPEFIDNSPVPALVTSPRLLLLTGVGLALAVVVVVAAAATGVAQVRAATPDRLRESQQ